MGHSHEHHHHHQGNKNILMAFFLNAGFAVIELIGGYLTNSMAIYSDALHDFGDSLALLFSYFAEKISHKKADEKLKESKYRILTRYRKAQLVVMDYKYFKEKVEPLLIEK